MTKVPDVPVSVGRTAKCRLPSRHPPIELPCADGGDFVNVRGPYHTSPFQSVCWLVFAVVWFALKRLEAVELGEGALSKLSADNVYDHLGFTSVSSATSGALAPSLCPCQLSIRLVWRTSIGGIAVPYLHQKKDNQERVTREGLAYIYDDPTLGHDDRVYFDFVRSLARLQLSIWTLLCLKLVHNSHFGRQALKPTFQGSSKSPDGNW